MSQTASSFDQLLDILNEGEEFTYDELQKALGASQRQIQRLMAQIRSTGAEIEERHVGHRKLFRLAEGRRRHPVRVLQLTEDEILALSVAAQAARSVLDPTPLREPLRSAFKALLAEFSTQAVSFDIESQGRQWHFGEARSAQLDRRVFDDLRKAIEERRSVRIDYLSASSGRSSARRKIDPYCLAARSGSWLLVAYCHLRNDVREFNVVDISCVEPCDETNDTRPFFDMPDDFDLDLYFRDRFRAVGGDEVRRVRLLVQSDRARYFRRKSYHPTQRIEEHPDGSITVEFDLSGLDEIRSFAQSWGSGVKVLEPRELVRIMADQAEEVARMYGRIGE